MKETTIIIGDSIAYGAWDIAGGWADRIKIYREKLRIESNKYYLTYNIGISAETTDDLIKRYKQEIIARLDGEKNMNQCILAFGMNDIIMDGEVLRVDPEKFRSNLVEVISWIKSVSVDPLLASITPINESIPAGQMLGRTDKNINLYNQIIKEVTDVYGVIYVDVYSKLKKLSPSEYLNKDGLHPNDKGHEIIATEVIKYL